MRVLLSKILVCVLRRQERSTGSPPAGDRRWCLADTRVRLTCGLVAPVSPRPPRRPSFFPQHTAPRSRPGLGGIFMLRWRPLRGHGWLV
jgi:hypothetical protein